MTVEAPTAAPTSQSIADRIAASFVSDDAVTIDLAPATPDPTAGGEQPGESDKAGESTSVSESTLEDFLGEEGGTEIAETSDDDDEVPADVKAQGEKAVVKWSDLKKKEKEFDRVAKENEELKTQLQKGGSTDAAKELVELKQILAEKERIITGVAITESDEYYHAVTVPFMELEGEIKALANDEEHANEIFNALDAGTRKLRNERLSEVTESMSDLDRTDLLRLAAAVDQVRATKQALMEKSALAKEEIDRNRLAQKGEESAKDKAARIEASETVWKNIVKKLPFLADEEGKVLDEFKDIREKGQSGITDEMSLGARAFAAYAVNLVPKMDTIIKTKNARIQELETAVKAMKGSRPNMGGGSDTEPRKGESASDRIIRQMAGG